MLVAYCRLCCHCRNLAEGGCLLSQFHFTRCRYFLGHIACRNLPWQGLFVAVSCAKLQHENQIIVSLRNNFYFRTSLFYASLYCCWKLIKNDGQTTDRQSMGNPQGYATHMDQPEMDYTC